ncbi:ABC transporter substrate-binding protein [Chitinimonas sp. BJYL2]|uniref:ABC transporter substrate-binding protein n=1 Tax=Chitinimonas sp. BJYL2 TaxID=2976696 RepID=UPI0022B3A77F|nr:ABC transporter substrate-binding protein [Chitinimonas sp. BJYL2]
MLKPCTRLLLPALLGSLLMAPALAAKPLVYCADAAPEGFDPGMWDAAGTNNTTAQMFQGLVGFKRGGTALEPQLATHWEVSPDAKVFTFKLRRGVKFHTTPYFKPTRTFNADDVLFTFQRFLDPKHPMNLAMPGVLFIYPQNLNFNDQIDKVEKLDDYTVRFTLRKANVTFATYLAMAFAGIHSAEYGNQLLRNKQANNINNYPVGTGPYRFVSYQKDAAVRMEANPDYWGKPQQTKKLIFLIAKDANVRLQKLVNGECHIAASARDVDLATLTARPDIKLGKIQALNLSYLAFNLKHPALSKREVREALDISVDRNAVFKTLFPRGDAMQAVSAFPPAIVGYNKSLKNEFNPAKAKQLLSKAGFPNGFELDLFALPVVRPTNPNGLLLAQMLQADWGKIGVKVNIKSYEFAEYLRRAKNGEHGVYMSGWSGDNGDADDFLAPNLTCAASQGGTRFCNAEFDKLVEEGRATTDPAKRIKIYEKAQEIFKRERPWITLAHSTVYIPMKKDVQGFVMAPNGSVDFENVYR